EPQDLRRAPQDLDLPRARRGATPRDVAVLLRGHGEEDEPAAERVQRPGVEEPHRRAEQRRHLRVVTARVRSAGRRIAFRMTGDDEAVELTEERERRPVSGAAGRLGADARKREPRLGLEAKSGERLLDEARRLDLLEAELRMLAYALAEPHDLLRAAVDGGAHALFQFVLRHGAPFPALFSPPWTITTLSRPQARSRWASCFTPTRGAGSTRPNRRAARAGDRSSTASPSACSPCS